VDKLVCFIFIKIIVIIFRVHAYASAFERLISRFFAVIWDRLIVLQIRKEQVFPQIIQIKVLQELIKGFVPLLNFDKKLLSMGPRLRARSR
jgi:hypothetical protein